jgi:KDO2-lipid IV(A) lauroyltransferase
MFLLLFEVLMRLEIPGQTWVRMIEDPPIQDAWDSECPQGLLFLSGHHGNWENGHWWSGMRGKPALVVGRMLDNPLMERWILRSRAAHDDAQSVERSGAFFRIAKTLRRAGTVALVVDQNNRTEPVFEPFFGVPAAFHIAWAELAVRVRPRIVFACAIRKKFGELHYVSRELHIADEGTPEEKARDLLRQYIAALEECIRIAPEQYLWVHRRYRTRPPGEPPLYRPRRRRRHRSRERAAARSSDATASAAPPSDLSTPRTGEQPMPEES